MAMMAIPANKRGYTGERPSNSAPRLMPQMQTARISPQYLRRGSMMNPPGRETIPEASSLVVTRAPTPTPLR